VTRQQIMCHRAGETYMPTDTSQPSRHSEWLSETISFLGKEGGTSLYGKGL